MESTLSGRTYVDMIMEWKSQGYQMEIVLLRLNSPKPSLNRIATRVAQGGHNVPKADVF